MTTIRLNDAQKRQVANAQASRSQTPLRNATEAYAQMDRVMKANGRVRSGAALSAGAEKPVSGSPMTLAPSVKVAANTM